ncbi:hypothetical protein BWQ96_03503 [Gracilariopsis chorda]|uniref:Uncharacterized protein n=1 Tax=Gracilariopsis chorda TaxID=448386 RepID=A0A2V3IYB9_9FLOR|nr:hypothetical protein BWQ96_03503 [Gracilariopsis chorda]|eukprot:PXF46677.1 hypothetical protein BWQ96_03503 [Gracilariopsis chorda]
MNALRGVKRSRADAGEVISLVAPAQFAHPHAATHHHRVFKRARRLQELRAPTSQLSALLRSDPHASRRYQARVAFLRTLAAPEPVLLGMCHLLQSDAAALLSIVDLNTHQSSIMAVLNDCAARAVSMTALNVRGHAFCMADKRPVLTSFTSAYGHHRVACELVHYVAHRVFAGYSRMAISVLSGGGVRDVLIADWCAQHKLKTRVTPPHLIILRCESQRLFLIPVVV